MNVQTLDRVGIVISDTGTGDFTATTQISPEFLTPPEAGAVDGQTYYWMLQKGLDFQIFKCPWVAATNTVQRSAGTTIVSKISGTAGTSNIDLDGTPAFLRTPTTAELLDALIESNTHAATGKSTPVDADEMPLVDSAASNVLKKLTWANLKATLKTYFDTLYQAAGTYLTASSTSALTNKDLTSGTNTFPTFNQNTTGSAAKLTTARNIDGQAFDGSAAITVIAPGTHAATGKTTPVDADELPIVDSASSNVLKKLTWANLKATLKTYFDTLYQAVGNYLKYDTTATITVGYTYTPASITTGSFTVNPATQGLQYVTNGGAYTITAPTSDGEVDILITNNGSAGATTFSGFTVGSSTGDALTTTNTSKFLLSVKRINGTSTYTIKALQ